jgi:hypothetical protein
VFVILVVGIQGGVYGGVLGESGCLMYMGGKCILLALFCL